MAADHVKTRRILCVGLVCLDIVNVCPFYPKEDEDVRAEKQQWKRGGNAGNTLTVLRMLDREGEFLGTLGSGSETEFVVSDLDRLGILHQHCVVYDQCRLPTSCVVLNSSNASRTIVHYRDLPELSFEDFSKLDLSQYSWIHFEGRNASEVKKMIAHVRQFNATLTISVEMEKKKPELAQLLDLPDVLLMSKEYAGYHGYTSPEKACQEMRKKARDSAVVVCAWGERGAVAVDADGQLHVSPSYPPEQLVDTLGAGDTFNAAMIHKMSTGASVSESVAYACRLAGAKCGMEGFEDLRKQ